MLTINGKNLCSLCFSEIPRGTKTCACCNGMPNITRYSTALKEGVILRGRYVVGKVLGKGGFGITYLCYDLKENRRVAIKEYLPDTLAHRNSGETRVSIYDGEKEGFFKSGAQKFFDEAKLVSRFNGNPNIISVYEFFYENNTTYFAMEYLDGVDFKTYISQHGGRLNEGEVLYVANKVTEALMIIHSAGILHRDISPDNVFICSNGNIKLIDFGAARQVVGEASKSMSVILKQGFAPLEQYQKKGKQGPWTDIYALGASMYYAIKGEVPEDAMTRLEDDRLDLNGVSAETGVLIRRMLAPKASDRPQSVIELKNAFFALEYKMRPTVTASAISEPLPSTSYYSVLPANHVSASPKPSFFKSHLKLIIIVAASLLVLASIYPVYYFATKDSTSESFYDEVVREDEKPKEPKAMEVCAAAVKSGGKWGFVDSNGNTVVDCVYEKVGDFSENLAPVYDGEKWGYIDTNGNVVIGFKYSAAESFSEGLAAVYNGRNWGFIDASGNVVIDFDYDGRGDCVDGRVAVKKGNNWGFVDKNGDEVIKCEYELIGNFSQGYAKVQSGGKWGFIDTRGKVVVDIKYDDAWGFAGGLAGVKQGELWGYINKRGDVVIEPVYAEVGEFSDGYALVKKGDLYGYINKKGETVIDFKYSAATRFNDGLAAVATGDVGYIDKNGDVVIDCIYQTGGVFSEGYARVKYNDMWGFIDVDGNRVVECKYEEIRAMIKITRIIG